MIILQTGHFGSELKMLHPFLNLSDKLKIRQFKPVII